MKQFSIGCALLACISLAGCRPKNNQNVTIVTGEVSDTSSVRITPVYAKGFKVTYTPTCRLVDISDPQKEGGESFHYALVPGGTKPRKYSCRLYSDRDSREECYLYDFLAVIQLY